MSGQRKAPRSERPRSGWWRETLLTLGAVLGVIAIVAAVGAAFFGLTPLIFRSGSMSPAIATGALAIAKDVPAADLSTGDIVSVTNREGVRITHRIQSVDSSSGQVTLTLKGDANAAPDAETYAVSSVDRVLFSVPRAGYVVSFVSGPTGIFIGGAFVAVLLFLAFGSRGAEDRRPGNRKAAAVVVVAGLGLAARGGVGTTGTLAAFTDSSVMTTTATAFTAATVSPPDSATCSTTSPSATITWPEKSATYDYEVTLKRASGATSGSVVSTKLVTGAAVSQSYTAPTDFGFGALSIGTYDFTVEVRSYPTGVPTWKSSATVASKKIRVGVLSVIASNTSCV